MGSEFVQLGGLLSYGASISDLHYRAAAFVDQILKGADPAGSQLLGRLLARPGICR